MPEEFQSALNKNAALKKAFAALTPRRQRALSSAFFLREAIHNAAGSDRDMHAADSIDALQPL
jgi:uncharacterized protein YdeI (YjbR/CyaY-like superfamily)